MTRIEKKMYNALHGMGMILGIATMVAYMVTEEELFGTSSILLFVLMLNIKK